MLFVFQVISAAVTGLMTWVLILKEKKVLTLYDFVFDPSCLLCLVGAIAFVVSGLGWFGPFREHVMCLKIVS